MIGTLMPAITRLIVSDREQNVADRDSLGT